MVLKVNNMDCSHLEIRIKKQKEDNANLINKITILNNDIKDYEKATKHLVNENNSLIKAKEYRDVTINSLNKNVKALKITNTVLITMLLLIIVMFFFYGGAKNKIIEQQRYELQYCKDSIAQCYIDTLWTCYETIEHQSRELIKLQNRFNFAIDYYTASKSNQEDMERDMIGLIIDECKRPEDYIKIW